MFNNLFRNIGKNGVGTVTINGRTLTGSNLMIAGGDIYIDGNKVDFGEITGNKLDVTVTGDINEVKVDGDLVIDGNILGSATVGGNANVDGSVGNINAGGNVNVDGKAGNINAGGNVRTG
jgi:hypothetical protein